MDLNCFKAYDVRGQVPDEPNEDLAYRIGNATAQMLGPGPVIVGRDIRLRSPANPQLDFTDGVSASFPSGGSTCTIPH
jgi:phosphomannomutase/phosphoglucomutase